MPQPAWSRALNKLLNSIPLRTVLIAQLVLLIAIAVVSTGALSYFSGQHAVRSIISRLEVEISDRIEQTLETYLQPPVLVTNLSADAVRLELLDLNNLEQTRSFLWSVLQHFNDRPCQEKLSTSDPADRICTNLALIAIATKDGNYVDFEYNPVTGLVQTSLRDRNQDEKTRTWTVNDWGKQTRLMDTYDYDPRQRDWYKHAVQAGRLVWSGPFLTAPPNSYEVVSVDRPLSDRQGNVLGVTGVAVSLVGLDHFLQNLKVSSTGQAFIVEPNGELIATSTAEQPFLNPDQQRLAINSENELTQVTAKRLVEQFGAFHNISKPEFFNFRLNGQHHFARIEPLGDRQLRTSATQPGLNWLAITVIPENDFTGQIKGIASKTALICLGALIFAIPIGIVTNRWITKPILKLSQAANALAQGDWNRSVTIQRSGELGVLVDAFNHMRHELRLSHQQLEEYSHGLEQKNEQLRTLEAELRRQLNLFLHAVSHDLRNPVLGTSMVLSNLSSQEGDQIILPRKVLERMQESNQRQLDLINSLIDTHAAEIWGIALHSEPLALKPLVDSALVDLQPMMLKEQTQLENRIPADLPLVQVDPLQLARVYQNLLANALKHNPSGLTITLEAQLQNQQIYCTVTDNGVGITPEQCDRLFDPYFRGASKPKSVGLGLGLYLCQQIIHAHNGTIGVKSQPGQGTTFWFTLPLSQPV